MFLLFCLILFDCLFLLLSLQYGVPFFQPLQGGLGSSRTALDFVLQEIAMTKLLAALLFGLTVAQPDWCRWVPLASQQYVPSCSGYVYPAGYGYPFCASWCRWVPGPSWGYTPECLGCYGYFTKNYQSAAQPVSPVESGCKTSCQWLSRPKWKSTPDCESCEQAMQHKVSNTVTEVSSSKSTGLKVRMQALAPDWCKWVPPGSLQYVAACNGVNGAGRTPTEATQEGCATWCVYEDVSSWQYTPECSSCNLDNMTNSTLSFNAGCKNWCQHVSRPAWQDMPDCADCEALAQAAQATKGTEILPWVVPWA